MAGRKITKWIVPRTAPIAVSAGQAVGGGESACTPDSVRDLAVRWRPSISAGDCPPAPAAYPGSDGRDHPPPARPCSGWGLPSHPGRPGCWCALTAPFHPYLCGGLDDPSPSAVCSLLHFPAGHPDWVLPSILPCGVRTFLGRITTPKSGSVRGHPADSPPLPFNHSPPSTASGSDPATSVATGTTSPSCRSGRRLGALTPHDHQRPSRGRARRC